MIYDGYYGRPDVTLSRSRNLWFHTGDLGWLDEDGYFTFGGRLDDRIRRGGENIDPRSVEQAVARHPAIREVRGAGLFIGVELGANAASGRSGAAETRRVVNGLCRRGVLVGSTGRDGNVLKIRSPLTLELQHADLLLEALDQTLQSAQ